MNITRHLPRNISIHKASTGIVWMILLLGLIFRLGQYIANRSLWLDEAMLALNIVRRTFFELTQPLDYNQGAPLGFLFVEKSIVTILGNRDFILRLFPLVAGILSLYLMYRLSSFIFKGVAVLLPVALFVFSDRLIYYASEAKQYSSDVAIVLLLYVFAAKIITSEEFSYKDLVVLTLTGVISVWLSHPALFVLVAISAGLISHFIIKGDRGKLIYAGAIVSIWLINCIVLYLVSLRPLAGNRILIEFWRDYFMPMPPWSQITWFKSALFNIVVDLNNQFTYWIGAALFLLGCLSIMIRKWEMGLILILPFPLTLFASGLRLYPFSDRLLLFISPIVFLFIGEGVERVRSWLSRSVWISWIAWSFLTVLLLYTPVTLALPQLEQPRVREHIKPVMNYIRIHRLEEDSLCVDGAAIPAFEYYASYYGLSNGGCTFQVEALQDPDTFHQWLQNMDVSGRIWFIFSHINDRKKVNSETMFLENLDHLGTRLDEFQAAGASVYLVQIRK